MWACFSTVECHWLNFCSCGFDLEVQSKSRRSFSKLLINVLWQEVLMIALITGQS